MKISERLIWGVELDMICAVTIFGEVRHYRPGQLIRSDRWVMTPPTRHVAYEQRRINQEYFFCWAGKSHIRIFWPVAGDQTARLWLRIEIEGYYLLFIIYYCGTCRYHPSRKIPPLHSHQIFPQNLSSNFFSKFDETLSRRPSRRPSVRNQQTTGTLDYPKSEHLKIAS